MGKNSKKRAAARGQRPAFVTVDEAKQFQQEATGVPASARAQLRDHKTKTDDIEPFRFEHGGQEYELPVRNDVPIGEVRKMRRMSQVDQLFHILELLLPDQDDGEPHPTMAAIDSMTGTEFLKFQKQWAAYQKENGQVALGE